MNTMHGPRVIDCDADLEEGLARLGACEPRFAAALGRCGPLPLRRRDPGLHGLLGIISAQQLSVASAAAIFARFESAFAPFDAARLISAPDAELRACGLSGPKIRTIRSIATSIVAGDLDLDALQRLPADEAHGKMVGVKGIGPWTADIYLMFCLGHADAFAAGDLALQESARLLFELEARPSAGTLTAMAEGWRPWRSVAARLLWAYYRVAKSREGIGAG